jgi:hypothetical protein
METKGYDRGPGERLAIGATIVANARVVDTALVKARLAGFIAAHRDYAGAQSKVDDAEARLRGLQAKALRRERAADDAVETLALTLIAEGHPRTKPFGALGGVSPSAIKSLAIPAKAKAIHDLVAAVQRSRLTSQKTRDAARAADQAARAMEAALLAIDPAELELRQLRGQRDTLGHPWERALASLRRGARAAFDEGAPTLYTALFGVPPRPARKNGKPTATPTPDLPPAPASTA